MTALLTDTFSLRTGAVDADDTLALLAGYDPIDDEDAPHTCLLIVNDGMVEDKVLLDWRSSSACALAPGTFLVFGEFGDYLLYERGTTTTGKVFTEADSGRQGIMRAGAAIDGGTAVWVGMSGLAFQRAPAAGWTSFGVGLPSDIELEGLIASANGQAFAFGWKGAVFRLQDRTWVPEQVPTNVTLTCGAAAPDGSVFIGGQNGTILNGHDGSWNIAVADASSEDLWGACWFDGELYLSTMSFVYVLDDDQMRVVRYQDQIPDTCYHLISNGNALWSIGERDLFRLKDKIWQKIDLPSPV